MLGYRTLRSTFLIVVMAGVIAIASSCIRPRKLATAASEIGAVNLEALRWTDWIRGVRKSTLTFAGQDGVRTTVLLDTFLERAILVAVDRHRPRVYCLYEFDTIVEAIVLEAHQKQGKLPQTIHTIVLTGNLSPKLASPQDIADLRAVLERMSDRELREAQLPVVDIGFLRWFRGRAQIMRALDNVFPMDPSGKWVRNARGERRLGDEPFY